MKYYTLIPVNTGAKILFIALGNINSRRICIFLIYLVNSQTYFIDLLKKY